MAGRSSVNAMVPAPRRAAYPPRYRSQEVGRATSAAAATAATTDRPISDFGLPRCAFLLCHGCNVCCMMMIHISHIYTESREFGNTSWLCLVSNYYLQLFHFYAIYRQMSDDLYL